jgi:hypothetical protein
MTLGESTTDTYGRIQKESDNDSLSHAQVFRCHKDSVNGRETVEDEPRSGRASTNVDRVRAFIRQDQRLTIRIIADELNIHECMIHQILMQDLNMRTVRAKTIPKNTE